MAAAATPERRQIFFLWLGVPASDFSQSERGVTSGWFGAAGEELQTDTSAGVQQVVSFQLPETSLRQKQVDSVTAEFLISQEVSNIPRRSSW